MHAPLPYLKDLGDLLSSFRSSGLLLDLEVLRGGLKFVSYLLEWGGCAPEEGGILYLYKSDWLGEQQPLYIARGGTASVSYVVFSNSTLEPILSTEFLCLVNT